MKLETMVGGALIVATLAPLDANSAEAKPTGAILLRMVPPSSKMEMMAASGRSNVLVVTSSGWTLSPLYPGVATQAEVHPLKKSHGVDKIWAVAHPPTDKKPPTSRKAAWTQLHELLRKWSLDGTLTNLQIEVAEPDFEFETKRRTETYSKSPPGTNVFSLIDGPAEVVVGSPPSIHWSVGKEFGWHLGPAYSQLRMARESVWQAGAATNPVHVVLLDTGARIDYAIIPGRYRADEAINLYDPPGDPAKWPLHGTSTTALLAGRRVTGVNRAFSSPSNPEGRFEDWVGGNPWVETTTYRIHDSVVHISTSTMAAGIVAATDHGADVVSISHGGLPSFAWAAAVNHAYSHGTAIFAASGDFFDYFILHTPHWVVYPAAFSRVMAVPGVTASYKSYGKVDRPLSFFRFQDWGSYFMRGSYGPRFAMHHAVCGFSPNTPWAGELNNLIDLDGAGTSASTPQVAAAASLWLQLHRYDGGLADEASWRSHKKVDAVYFALQSTARIEGLKPRFDPLYFGLGTVSAADALNVPYSADRPEYPDAEIELIRLLLLITDWGGPTMNTLEIAQRPSDPIRRSLELEALQTVFSSTAIQRILEDIDDPAKLDQEQRKKIARLILDSSETSGQLRQAAALLKSR